MSEDLKKRKLRAKAIENTSVSRISNGVKREVKEGNHIDKALKTNPQDSVKFGLSKGITRNMGDFESFRADAWITDSLEKDETIEEGFKRLSDILTEALESVVSEVIES